MKAPRVVTLTLHPAIDRVIRIREMIPGGTFDGAEEIRVPAGKGVNTARELKALGAQRVIPCAWVGASEAAWYARTLKKISGLSARLCPRRCATRIAQTFLEAAGRETHIKESMPAGTDREQNELVRFWCETIQFGDIVAICGSAPPRTMLANLILNASSHGASYILADTNGEMQRIAGSMKIDLLKGNASEIGSWLDLKAPFDPHASPDQRALMERMNLDFSPHAILITLGAKGAVLAERDTLLYAKSPRLPAKFKIAAATGCGDAATAGVLWSLVLGERDPEKMLARAVACGTAKLATADPGLLDTTLAKSMVRYCRTVHL